MSESEARILADDIHAAIGWHSEPFRDFTGLWSVRIWNDRHPMGYIVLDANAWPGVRAIIEQQEGGAG